MLGVSGYVHRAGRGPPSKRSPRDGTLQFASWPTWARQQIRVRHPHVPASRVIRVAGRSLGIAGFASREPVHRVRSVCSPRMRWSSSQTWRARPGPAMSRSRSAPGVYELVTRYAESRDPERMCWPGDRYDRCRCRRRGRGHVVGCDGDHCEHDSAARNRQIDRRQQRPATVDECRIHVNSFGFFGTCVRTCRCPGRR